MQIAFSQENWADIVTYHHEVVNLLQRTLAGLAVQDSSITNEVLSRRQWLNQIKQEIQLRHLQQLRSGSPTSLNASAIHLEMVSAMSRILSHTCSMTRMCFIEIFG